MSKKAGSGNAAVKAKPAAGKPGVGTLVSARPSSLLDARVVYCGDCLEQLKNLPDACVDLIYIDPPFNSNRNYEVLQVKQTDKVGRPVIDQFCTVMERENRQRGFVVCFGFSEDAFRECVSFQKRTGRIIKLLTVQSRRAGVG